MIIRVKPGKDGKPVYIREDQRNHGIIVRIVALIGRAILTVIKIIGIIIFAALVRYIVQGYF